MRRWTLTLGIALLTAIATPAGAAERPPQTPHVLPASGAKAAAAEPSTWLVGARPGANTAAIARRHGATLLSPRGGFEVARSQARAFAAELKRAGVYIYAEPNQRLRRLQDPAPTPTPAPPYDEYAATDWRAYLIPATLVPPNPATAPLTAVVDSAVDVVHPDLAGITVVGDPAISDLHGTAVAAVIGGRANGFGMVGVFPGAPILSVGSGLRVSDVIKAISTAVKAKAKVINMSLGSPAPSYAMFVELAYGVSQGALPVASAGNDFETVLSNGTRNPVEFPAAFPHVLSVAAIGPNGATSSFSTANGAVDLAAPGESILTAVPVALDDDGAQDGFQRLAGTSFAAPIVSGVAAWLMAARPNLTGAQVADILRYSATDVDKAGWDSNTGYGVVNLAGALTREDPPVDTTEVNDDIEWIDGTRFSRADTPVFKAGNSRKVYGGYVDAWKDPADVYRIEVAKGRKVTVKLSTKSRSDPDLALFGAKAMTIYSKKARLGVSFRGTGKTESVTVRNRGRKKMIAYIAVYAPGSQAALLDAPYGLTIRR